MNNPVGQEDPPRSLDQLRSLLAGVMTRAAPTHLGTRAQRTLAALIDSPRQTAVYSITELADMVGVNTSTLTRLAKRLGYSGFTELQADDVLVALGSSPYTRATVEACRIAAAHGIHIIAITDSYGSPLAACANETFITPTGGTFFSNSTAASLILAEGLLALVARSLRNEALEALRRRETLIDELGVATPPGPS